MFTEIWNNKGNILNNYIEIVKRYLPDITILIILFALIIIYAYIRYKGFKLQDIKNPNLVFAPQEPVESLITATVTEGFTDGNTIPLTLNSNPTPFCSLLAGAAREKGRRRIYVTPVALHAPCNPVQTVTPKMPSGLFITPDSQKQILQTIHNTYLDRFNQPNIQARGFDTCAELVRSYNKCLIPITDSEKQITWQRIYEFIDTIHDSQCKQYINTWLTKIQIAKGATWLESGMPHTHANCIIMRPDWFAKQFKGNTFIHELIHVIQRDDFIPWHKLYHTWGFIQATELSGLESYINLTRANPDGMSTEWVWHSDTDDKYYWIAAVYKSVTPNTLTDVNYLAIPVIRTSRENTFKYTGSTPRQLTTFTEFRDYFGIDENHYHTNEIAAQYAEYYFSGAGDKMPEHMQKYPGYNTFDNWLSKIINNHNK